MTFNESFAPLGPRDKGQPTAAELTTLLTEQRVAGAHAIYRYPGRSEMARTLSWQGLLPAAWGSRARWQAGKLLRYAKR
jgi:hypothetical protein